MALSLPLFTWERRGSLSLATISSVVTTSLVIRLPLSSYASLSLGLFESLAYVFDGVLSSFPSQVHKTLPMKLKAQVRTAGMAWFNPISKQPEKLLGKSGGIQNKVPIGTRLRRKLMHPERRLGRLVSLPSHSWCIEEIEIPYRGVESQNLSVKTAELTLRVPDMGHPEALKWLCLRLGRLSTVVRHHREPYGKTLQAVGVELL